MDTNNIFSSNNRLCIVFKVLGPIFTLNGRHRVIFTLDDHIKLPFEAQTSEYQASKSLFFRSFRYSDVCYSGPHCIF